MARLTSLVIVFFMLSGCSFVTPHMSHINLTLQKGENVAGMVVTSPQKYMVVEHAIVTFSRIEATGGTTTETLTSEYHTDAKEAEKMWYGIWGLLGLLIGALL